MTDKNWNQEKIEKLLSEMPDIKDNRSKSEILNKLKKDQRVVHKKKRDMKKWMPAFVSVAALLVISLLIPSMMNMNQMKESADNSSRMMIQNEMDSAAKHDQDDAVMESFGDSEESEVAVESSEDMAVYMNGFVQHSAVYPEDLGDSLAFHFGLAGSQANSVPVTFIILNERIEKDFGTNTPTSLQLYEKYANLIDEESLGFDDYHPYNGEFKVQDQSLILTLPENHGYDRASALWAVFVGTLKDTFYGFNEILYKNPDGSIMENQEGQASKPLILNNGVNHYNYYRFIQEGGQEFLVPESLKSFDTFEEAIQEMKAKPNDLFDSVIPAGVTYKVSDEGDIATITFDNPLDLRTFEPRQAMQMIEGILLAGASFDKQLKFENVVQTKWAMFDFTKALPVPIGPNFMPFELK